jgi:hypothetical protein
MTLLDRESTRFKKVFASSLFDKISLAPAAPSGSINCIASFKSLNFLPGFDAKLSAIKFFCACGKLSA